MLIAFSAALIAFALLMAVLAIARLRGREVQVCPALSSPDGDCPLCGAAANEDCGAEEGA